MFNELLMCDHQSIIYAHKFRNSESSSPDVPSQVSPSSPDEPFQVSPSSPEVPSQVSPAFPSGSSEVQFAKALLSNALHSKAMNAISNVNVTTEPCCSMVYNNKISICDVFAVATTSQSNNIAWHEARKFRVTGSRCYSLFTYSKMDWATKASQYFWPRSFSTKYTKFGIQNEPHARDLYALKKQTKVHEFGLIISQKNPWLAFSPDGVVFRYHIPSILIEIKCVYALPNLSIVSLLKYCKWLKLVGDVICLKQKHSYYGQVQMGMALLNLPVCHLVIYCKQVDDIKIVPVKYDMQFVCKLLPKLKNVYFKKMLPVLCKHEQFQGSLKK